MKAFGDLSIFNVMPWLFNVLVSCAYSGSLGPMIIPKMNQSDMVLSKDRNGFNCACLLLDGISNIIG